MRSFGIPTFMVFLLLSTSLTFSLVPSGPLKKPLNSDLVYAAIGGSWAAGVPNGAELYPGSPCKQHNLSYPILFSSQLALKPTNFHFLACAADDIYGVIWSQVPRIPANAGLVSISAGLDALSFGDVVQTCDVDADSDKCDDALSRALAALYLESGKGNLYRGMHVLVEAIQQQAPAARIVILGLPRWLGSPVRDCHRNFRPGKKEVSPDQRDAINELAFQVDAVLHTVATQMKSKEHPVVLVQDPDLDWTDHRYCDEQREGTWFVEKDDVDEKDAWASGYYHPNVDGQVEMKNLLVRALQTIDVGQ